MVARGRWQAIVKGAAMGGARVGAALLAVLLTAACTDGSTGAEPPPEPDVSVTETPTETGSPTADPPPTPPPLPAAATQPTKAGAVAFARHYFEMVNYSLESLDTGPLRELTYRCRGCDGGADSVDDIAENSGVSSGGLWTTLSVEGEQLGTTSSEKRFGLRMQMRSSPQRVEYPEPRDDELFRGGRREAGLSVDWREGSWTVGYLEFR